MRREKLRLAKKTRGKRDIFINLQRMYDEALHTLESNRARDLSGQIATLRQPQLYSPGPLQSPTSSVIPQTTCF